MILFQELPTFTRQAADLLLDDELFALQDQLLERPAAGDIIPGGKGLRKLRWRGGGRGKRGGLRIIYFWVTDDGIIILCRVYAKNEQENLGKSEVRQILQQLDP
jgi:mRNA-degrading endonuclease RelE of RelBE toxin-antitoxin system